MSDAAEEDKGLDSFEPRPRRRPVDRARYEKAEEEAEVSSTKREERLNAQYREEGWGLITDRVFDGVEPSDVETSAREVARFAFDMEKNHQKQLKDADDALGKVRSNSVALESQLEHLRALYEVEQVLKDLEIQELTRVRAAQAIDMLDVKLWFARARAQGLDVPKGFNTMQLQEWRAVK